MYVVILIYLTIEIILNVSGTYCQAHLQLALCQRTIPKAAKEPVRQDCFITRQSLNKTVSLYRDSLKTLNLTRTV